MKNLVSKRRILILISLLLATFASAQDTPDVPTVINYQGFLTDSNGKALEGKHKITFRIYQEPTGTLKLVWEEVHDSVLVTNGMFNVLLGSISPLGSEHFTGNRYLEIKMQDEVEMEPRLRLASVPYSLRAEQANHALKADRAFTLDAPEGGPENIVYVDNTGNVGIGNTNPSTALDVNGSVNVSGKFAFPDAFGWNWVDAVAAKENATGWVTVVDLTDKNGILLMVQATGGAANANNEVRIYIDNAITPWKSYKGTVLASGNNGWLLSDDSADHNSGMLTIMPFKTFHSLLRIDLYNAGGSSESNIRVNYLVED